MGSHDFEGARGALSVQSIARAVPAAGTEMKPETGSKRARRRSRPPRMPARADARRSCSLTRCPAWRGPRAN